MAAAATQAATQAAAAAAEEEGVWQTGRTVTFVARQTEQGLDTADCEQAEAHFAACGDRQLQLELTSMAYRSLQKLRQIEKRVHFMEGRQDSSASLPAEAPQSGTDREGGREGQTETERERGRERERERESGETCAERGRETAWRL